MLNIPVHDGNAPAGAKVRWGDKTATILIRRKTANCEICGARNKTVDRSRIFDSELVACSDCRDMARRMEPAA